VSSLLQEKQLLEGLISEDRKVVEQIYRDNYPVIQSLVINNNGSVDDAADIFQEAMIVLFEKAKDPDFELNCLIRTYLYSVARRLWLKKLQQMQRFGRTTEAVMETVPVDDDLDAHIRKQQDFNLMESAMNKIGEPCKTLLEAYYIHKKSMLQIAEEFGYTNTDNAKTQKYKCLVRLKKLFFAQYKYTE